MYQDKTFTCLDCNAGFTWTAGEQEFYAQKGFDRPPIRCSDCRKKRRGERQGGQSGPKKLYDIKCANCGKDGQVPFQPRSSNVLCADCFRAQRAGNTAPTSAPVEPKMEATDQA